MNTSVERLTTKLAMLTKADEVGPMRPLPVPKKPKPDILPGPGRGRNRGTSPGAGPGDVCVCYSCGTTVPHRRNVPCYSQICPKCGTDMGRE